MVTTHSRRVARVVALASIMAAGASSRRTTLRDHNSSRSSIRSSRHRVSHRLLTPSSRGSNEPRYLTPALTSPSAPASDTFSNIVTSSDAPSSDLPVGGRLQRFWRQWQGIGASKQVVNWLRFGYKLPFHRNLRGLPVTPLSAPLRPPSWLPVTATRGSRRN